MNKILRIVAIIGSITIAILGVIAMVSGELNDAPSWSLSILITVVGIISSIALFQVGGKDKEERGLEAEIRKAELRKKLNEVQRGEGPQAP